MNSHVHKVVGILHSTILELESAATIASPNDLDEINDALKNLKTAAADIVTREGQRTEAARRKQKWEEIVPQARAAKTKLIKLERQHDACHSPIMELQNAVLIAESVLANAERNKPIPDEYPSPRELVEHRELCDRLRADFEKARDAALAAVTARDLLQRQIIEARETFQRLEFQERQYRPRGAEGADLRVPSLQVNLR
jgi:hypothetical protein